MILLGCGGFVWYVSSEVQKELAQQEREAARRAADNPAANPPWQAPRPSPLNSNISSVSAAVDALAENSMLRRRDALRYLKGQTATDNQRDKVVAATAPLLSDFHLRGDAKAVLSAWATADQADTLIATANAAHGRRDRDTQRTAIELLAGTGSAKAASAVGTYFGTRHDVRAAGKAFEAIGPSTAGHVLPYFNDSDHRTRQTARGLLTKWEVEEGTLAAQSLDDLQSGDDNRAREAAQWFTSHVIVDEELSPKVSAALVALLANQNVRSDATAALKFWATSNTVPALTAAAAKANAANDRDTQEVCVVLLTGLADARALPTYAAYLQSRPDRTIAKAAFNAIGKSAAPALLPFVHSSDYSARYVAHELLKEWEVDKSQWLTQSMKDLQSGDEDRIRQAMRYLNDAEPDEAVNSAIALALLDLVNNDRLRNDAMRALSKWATSEAVPKLVELLEHEDRYVKSQALAALAATKDPRAIAHLAKQLEDSSTRRQASQYLVEMGPVAETAFWPLVTNKDWIVSRDACNALGRIGTEKSIPVLQVTANENRFVASDAAKSAITQIQQAKREPVAAVGGGESESAGPRQIRTWTDASGTNTIEALFIELSSGKVRLRTRGGKILSLNLDQLSPNDRAYVMKQIGR